MLIRLLVYWLYNVFSIGTIKTDSEYTDKTKLIAFNNFLEYQKLGNLLYLWTLRLMSNQYIISYNIFFIFSLFLLKILCFYLHIKDVFFTHWIHIDLSYIKSGLTKCNFPSPYPCIFSLANSPLPLLSTSL